MKKLFWVALVLVAGGAFAQATTDTPPPLVPASPPPMPAADPSAPPLPASPTAPTAAPASTMGTPPPPGAYSPPSYVPGSTSAPGYQYSPYGQPQSKEKPGVEWGLMLSESLFGMLTSAGITVLPYFLLFNNGGALAGESPLSDIIFITIFAATPLAVAQTEVGIANGSRYYMTDLWPAALTGLAGEAAVLGLFYLTGWLPHTIDGVQRFGQTCDVNGVCQGSVALLLIGAIGVVPLLQMAVINLFKQPKFRPYVENATPKKNALGISLAPPAAAPIFVAADGSPASGFQLSLLRGTW